jgi:hypothetical protein
MLNVRYVFNKRIPELRSIFSTAISAGLATNFTTVLNSVLPFDADHFKNLLSAGNSMDKCTLALTGSAVTALANGSTNSVHIPGVSDIDALVNIWDTEIIGNICQVMLAASLSMHVSSAVSNISRSLSETHTLTNISILPQYVGETSFIKNPRLLKVVSFYFTDLIENENLCLHDDLQDIYAKNYLDVGLHSHVSRLWLKTLRVYIIDKPGGTTPFFQLLLVDGKVAEYPATFDHTIVQNFAWLIDTDFDGPKVILD